MANPPGVKPKGMYWRTFERLRAEHDALAHASWAGMAERLGLMNQRLMDLRLDPLDDLGRDGCCPLKPARGSRPASRP